MSIIEGLISEDLAIGKFVVDIKKIGLIICSHGKITVQAEVSLQHCTSSGLNKQFQTANKGYIPA
jgi:hypothetical protein